MDHTTGHRMLLTLCTVLLPAFLSAFPVAPIGPQPGMVGNIRQHVNNIRNHASRIPLTPQDTFSRLMGEALVKAQGKLSLEQLSTAEIYFNEVFSNGSPDMQRGLTEMTIVLGKEIDKIYFSSTTKYRTLSNLLRHIFSHLRDIAIHEAQEAERRSHTIQQHLPSQNISQLERLFLLYRSLQTVITAVSRGVNEWLRGLPWIKMLIGSGALIGGYKLYKNKTLPKLWEMMRSVKALADTGTSMMREQERQQRAFFEEHAEIDWVATLRNARSDDQIEEKHEVHVVRYNRDPAHQRFEYLLKEHPLPDGYPADFDTQIREQYKKSKNLSVIGTERTQAENRVEQLLRQWKERIQAYKERATDAQWVHLPPSTIDRMAAAGKALAPLVKETVYIMKQNREQGEAWLGENRIAIEQKAGEEQFVQHSALRILTPAEQRDFAREARRRLADQGNINPSSEELTRAISNLVLSSPNTKEMRFMQEGALTDEDVNALEAALTKEGLRGSYLGPDGSKVVPTIYYAPDGKKYRTLLPRRNIAEQLLDHVFDPLNDPESISGRMASEIGLQLQRSRLDAELWLESIQPVMDGERPRRGWPREGDPEYETHKDRQFFIGKAPSDFRDPTPHMSGQPLYRHYPSENILKLLTDTVSTINRPDSVVGGFLSSLGRLLENLAVTERQQMKLYTIGQGSKFAFKANARRRRIEDVGSKDYGKYYWVLLDEGGNERLDTRYVESPGVNGLWAALSQIAQGNPTLLDTLVQLSDGIVGALRSDDPREAERMGRSLKALLEAAGFKGSLLGGMIKLFKTKGSVDYKRIPQPIAGETAIAYQARLESLRKEVLNERNGISVPISWGNSGRAATARARKQQRLDLEALALYISTLIEKIKHERHTRGGDFIVTDEITKLILASPARSGDSLPSSPPGSVGPPADTGAGAFAGAGGRAGAGASAGSGRGSHTP